MNSPISPHIQTSLPGKINASFRALQTVRILALLIMTICLTKVVELGTHRALLALATTVGVTLAGKFVVRNVRRFRIVAWHVGVFVAGWLILKGAGSVVAVLQLSPEYDFFSDRLFDHITLLALFYLVAFASTVYFWRKFHAATVESLALAVGTIWILSGHRNYQLDAPQTASEMAFALGVEPQHFLLGVGFVAACIIWSYLVLANSRPLFGERNAVVHRTGRRRGWAAATVALVLALFGGYAFYVNRQYSEQLSRASNGVGQKNGEGESPLGFHSAVGKTKQPAAVVRLETDYNENPYSPMLYFREGSLSEFNGKELVIGARQYDGDVPRAAPGQPFVSDETIDTTNRKRIVQSVYLLAKHNSVFAADRPQSIRLIKNPDPQRFELAYQAISQALTIRLQDLIGEEVGDTSWNKETWAHYLRAPGSDTREARKDELATEEIPFDHAVLDKDNEDLRYERFARKLTQDAATPVERAIAIVKYLSEESIYTRAPGHQVTTGGDPVAPYLFAEKKRGYCVHFAHAAVYMLRLMGIPARIGTGYLTDLTYAKDGHILLQMGDRHAWPEIYVRGLGWIVFDVTPAQAENEQVLVPDEKLLDELMQKLDPAEQFVTPPPAPEKEQSTSEKIIDNLVTRRNALLLAVIAALGWLGLKSWLRFGYKFAATPAQRIRRAYAASSSLLFDLGHSRAHGETREEYSARINRTLGVETTTLTDLAIQNAYGSVMSDRSSVEKAIAQYRSTAVKIPLWRRIAAFLSPLSLSRIGRW